MRDELRRLSPAERFVVAALAAWILAFVALKLPHAFSPDWIEWDARAMGLAAFRFHGTGLFPRDLGADLAAAMCPLGWRAIYWLGTLVTDPYQVSRLVPLALLVFLCWQVLAVVRARAGLLLGLGALFLVLHCPFFWDRMAGGNPRAFGLPLVIAFLRYTTEGRLRSTALVLVAQAAFYPSVLLVCAPAWTVLVVVQAVRERRWQPLAWLAATGLVCGLFVLPSMLRVDPRIGPPIRIEQLAHLMQRSIWSLFPLPPHEWVARRAIGLPLQDPWPEPLFIDSITDAAVGMLTLLAALSFGVALLRRHIPLSFLVTLVSSVTAYLVACAVAYRLYVPDRLIHYVWTPAILLLLAPLVAEVLALLPERIRPRRASLAAVLVVVALALLGNGTGLASQNGLHDWSARRTATMSFIAGLPEDALVVAHPALASDVEVFGRHSVLFSGITNAPNFSTYGLTVEQRILRYYDAYYARSMFEVRSYATSEQVDYLIVDLRDFGPDAEKRARYVSPWTERALFSLRRTPASSMALAHPPPGAIVFRDGTVLVLDTKKL